MKKSYFSICTKGFFTIYRVTYVMLLLHDNASTLRGLTCLILCLIYIAVLRNHSVQNFPYGGRGSIASLRSTMYQTWLLRMNFRRVFLFIIYLRKIPLSTSNCPTQKYKILYHATRLFQFRITILDYVGSLLLQWRYQTSFNKMEPILWRRSLMTSRFEM